MAYEMKQVIAQGDLLPALILQAKGEVISRSDVKNGGTLRVPAIAQAKVGDRLTAYVEGNGLFAGTVELNEVNLGKPLDFNVLSRVFSEGESIKADYTLQQGVDIIQSPITSYVLKD